MLTALRGPQARARRRSGEVRTLVLMLLLSSVAAAGGALAPMTPGAPTTLNAVLAAVGLLVVVLVWSTPWRGWRHVGPLVVLAGVTTVVAAAATPAGTATSAVGMMWVALHAALYFPRRVARLYGGLIAAALGGALWHNPFLGAAHTWVFMVLTTAAAGEALGGTVDRLHQQALTDPLTGLLNRAGLRREADRSLEAANRSGEQLTVLVADLDGFKAVNDRHGHAAGDALLLRLAEAWSAELRPTDLLARHGGDEFVLVLPGTGRAAAHEVAHRLATVSPIGWSYGLAAHAPGRALTELLHDADAELYLAKARRAPTQVA